MDVDRTPKKKKKKKNLFFRGCLLGLRRGCGPSGQGVPEACPQTVPGVFIHTHAFAQMIDGRRAPTSALAIEVSLAAGLALAGLPAPKSKPPSAGSETP